ncbi:MAG: late competence development ComFB family protein [Treponema sp.]|jgi:competence protein ComFB|nr:late competence development ComFB family protein [Treponema sp.]
MFTEIHNTVEDIVFAQVTEICDSIEKNKKGEICTCRQCRIDTACYVLNRIGPYYISSNRGVARVEQETIARQQKEAEIVSLIYEGIRKVNHNLRPFINHGARNADPETIPNAPIFNLPTIVGRILNGLNFEPLSEARVELRRNGDLVTMKDIGWQNPFNIVPNTEGTFTFWPSSIPAESVNAHKVFEYSIRIEAPDLELLTHFFKIPVTSEVLTTENYSRERSFKLPNLYMFPPGGVEDDF